METKANTALIGAFTLIVLALGFVFIYWLARGGEQGSNAPLTVIFQDPVTGLGVGSQVVFNGIKIGDVRTLELDPENPRVVIAGLSVQPLRSIKEDTEVTLGFQGLTGVGYVEMAGGSPELQPIWETMTDPTLRAARSSMQDLMAGARTILARADETLQSIEGLVSENTDDVSQAIRDVRSFTGALAENSDGVADLIEQIGAASSGIADATTRLQGIVERGEAVIGAVEPEQVRGAIANVHAMTENLSAQTERFNSILERADAVTADAQSFSQHLPALGERAEALAAAIDAEQLAATLDRLDAISAAIDPEQVRTTIANVASTAAAIGAHSAELGTIVSHANAIAADVRSFAQNLPALGEKADALAAAIDPAKVGSSIDRLDSITAAIDPEQVRSAIDNVTRTAEAVGAQSEAIGTIVARAAAISGNLESFSQNLPAIGQRTEALTAAIDPAKVAGSLDRLDSITAAIDPEQVRSAIDNVTRTAEAVGAQSEAIGTIVARADAISGNLQSFSQNLPAIGQRTEALTAAIDPAKVGGAIDRIDAIAAAVDPERVRVTVEGASSLAEALQANRENIDTIVTRFTSISNDLAGFASRLPVLGERFDGVLAALDSERLGRTLANVDQFATTLAANADDIDAIVENAKAVSTRFEALGARAESVLTKLDAMAGEGTGGILSDAEATLAAVRDAADNFNAQISALGGDLGDFSGRGLRNFQSLVSEGQQTISRLDRVISDLEQNPSGFLFGGSSAPEYNGRRR